VLFCLTLLAVASDLGGSLSGWATALVVLGSFAGLAMIVVSVVLAYRLLRRRKEHAGQQVTPTSRAS
jgi:hypothetical protein